jgi:hypothetical protein
MNYPYEEIFISIHLCKSCFKILLALTYTFIPVDYNDSYADASFISIFFNS